MSNALIAATEEGFKTVKVGDKYQEDALVLLEQWLTDTMFADYVPQISHMINAGYWDYLLDCFYQVIPFGTGGRRGEVGIGPNRINPWTIQASAQGHSQFLINQYGEAAKTRGVVLAYDVRQFFTNKYFDESLPNPVKNLNCKHLADAAAKVYAANGIKVYIFDDVRTTPELSFAIRHLKAVGGDMFSASHNPPEHNGKKVYDEFGGQLIPPEDEKLVDEVTKRVSTIKTIDYNDAVKQDLVEVIGSAVDDAYLTTVAALSLSKARSLNIVFTPMHGCGHTSVLKTLLKLGFKVELDPETGYPSGKFEHVTFNIPNPEVEQSFDTPLKFAKHENADIILNSDPDADRIGVMVHHNDEWKFLNGNEIGAILTRYVVEKKLTKLSGKGVIIKTQVTTNLIAKIAQENGVEVIGDLLVGFKYIGAEMNRLESEGRMDNFLMGCEESHGYIAGNYIREKDAVPAAIWLAELAAELKQDGRTLIDYLESTYSRYGFFRNYLTEIRLPGAEGMSQIQQIQTGLRTMPPQQFGQFAVENHEDWLNRTPIVSETDRTSKNALVFNFKPIEGTTSMKVTVRPSGTEPKIKMYYEIGSVPFPIEEFAAIQKKIEDIRIELEKAFMLVCYKLIGVDFPQRGFLLFWQLPLTSKLHYFEIEKDIAALKNEPDKSKRQEQLDGILAFLGSDPYQKVDDAFSAEYGAGIAQYLEL